MIYHSFPKIFLSCILNTVICQLSFPQSNQPAGQAGKAIDSLMNVLKTAREDTTKVNTLIALGEAHIESGSIDEGIKKFQDGIVLAEKLNFKKGMATSYFRIANVIGRQQRKYSQARENLFVALKLWEEIGNKREIAGMFHNLGLNYGAENNYSESLKYLEIAIKMYRENGQKGLMADTYNTIGTTHKTLGNYPEALNNYFASLRITAEFKNKRWEAACYTNIGNTNRALGNYTEALTNHFAALKIYERDYKAGIPIAYTNIGNAHNELGNYAEALKYHEAALKIWEADNSKGGMANVYASMGEGYVRQNKFPEALKNYRAALKIYEELKSKNGIADCCIGLGNVQIKLKNFQEAKEDLIRALSLSKETGAKERIKEAYEGLCKLDSAMGNSQQELIHYKLYTHYKDSLSNEASTVKIAQLKEQYESEKKDREIVQLNSDKQKLESDKQISALLLKANQDSLFIVNAENDKIQLENDRIHTHNLYNEQQITLLSNEKKLQQLQIEKDKSDLAVQTAETEKKQEEVVLLNKEKVIQSLQLKKQTQAKNYFIAGLALLTVLSFFVYRNYRNRQKLRMQVLRNKIASDLHDDVGSTLSSISIFSQMAQEQSKENIPLLETIGDSSRKMLDAMADIVWAIKPENDQFEKIIMRMRSFAYELLGARKIDFEFIADDDITNMKLPMEVRKNLYLIFKEATNNMVKYAQANKALFAIKGEKNNLTMMIQDNGKGFDLKRSTDGNGLKNMRKRATEIGAEFRIDSQPGSGTIIQLMLAV